jgi:hypothetical protein
MHPYTIYTVLSRTKIMSDCDESDDSDNEAGGGAGVGKSKKNAATFKVTEIFYFVLSLALNEIYAEDGLKTQQQESKILEKSLGWVGMLRSDYGAMTTKLMGTGGVTEDQLRRHIQLDTGKKLLKKAKEIVRIINNNLNAHWKEPTGLDSGNQRAGIIPC